MDVFKQEYTSVFVHKEKHNYKVKCHPFITVNTH